MSSNTKENSVDTTADAHEKVKSILKKQQKPTTGNAPSEKKAKVKVPLTAEQLELRKLRTKQKKAASKKRRKLKKRKASEITPAPKSSATAGLPEGVVKEEGKSMKLPLALAYLAQWATKREEWRFSRVRQFTLLDCKFDLVKIDKKHFKWLLKYIADIKGVSRNKLIEESTQKRDELEYLSEHELTRELRLIKKRAIDILGVLTKMTE